MVNTHYMVDGHPIHNKDPYNGFYKSRVEPLDEWLLTMSIDHSSYGRVPLFSGLICPIEAMPQRLSSAQSILGIDQR